MMRIWKILGAMPSDVALAGMLGSTPASAMSRPPAAAAQPQSGQAIQVGAVRESKLGRPQ
jgi:hypothetical protein